MAKFFLLPLLFVAVSMVESYTVVPYPSAAVPLPYGYPVAAPVSAGFRQSSLGPFFGYFPDMFSPPCAVCEIPPVANKAITKCRSGVPIAVSDMSDSPSGTIKLTTTVANDQCGYALMTTPGYKSISLKCAKVASELEITPNPSATLVEGGAAIDIGAQAYLKFISANNKQEIDCTWTAVKA